MPLCHPRNSRQAGFSLIFISILITVGALVMVSLLPGQEAGDVNLKQIGTIEKLERVEEAMRSFMAHHGRRPCPADGQYAINDTNFGREAAGAGACTGGTPVAPLGPDDGTGHVVGGTIPTKSLALDDSYAFDEWGRRFTYVVDQRATITGTCLDQMNFPTNNGTGGVLIKNGSGATVDTTMYAYISHGPDGYGAWPQEGSSTANRINTGSTDTDQSTNAGVSGDGNFTYNTTNFKNYAVFKDKTATFDDIVYYRNDIKNTCCLGPVCVPLGFRIGPATLSLAGTGDINGDGIADMVLAWGTSNIYVVFGSASLPNAPTAIDPAALNGTNGFVINPGGSSYTTVADLNGDGYADILIVTDGYGPWNIPTKDYIIFGGSGAWPATVNYSNLAGWTGVNGTNGFAVTDDANFMGSGLTLNCAGWYMPTLTVGDVDGDGHKDLVHIGGHGWGGYNGGGFVLFGKANNDPGNDDWQHIPALVHLSAFDGTNGFLIGSTDTNVFVTPGIAVANDGTTGDLNHDGYDDIVANTVNSGTYLIYGRSRADWQSALTTINGVPAVLDVKNELAAVPHRATSFPYWEIQMALADVNNDGTPDLLFHEWLIYGKTDGSKWAASVAAFPPAPSEGFMVWVNGAAPWSWNPDRIDAADVNGDGKTDLIATKVGASPLVGRTNAGAFAVFLQPPGGWAPNTNNGWGINAIHYSDFNWNGTDSFQIYGPATNSNCGPGSRPFVADVRPGDMGGNTPEIIISCPGAGYVYGIYRNNAYGGWPSVRDLLDLN